MHDDDRDAFQERVEQVKEIGVAPVGNWSDEDLADFRPQNYHISQDMHLSVCCAYCFQLIFGLERKEIRYSDETSMKCTRQEVVVCHVPSD